MSGIKEGEVATDAADVAISDASSRPLVRSPFETAATGALLLSALGLWMLVIPIELLGFMA